ncbi:hypothetical protein MBLNU459_g3246t1 [Dothideomycetes sp. NU459]
MSLNGLDTPEVQQAHNAALADAGGWFLLKYVSRDSVELLDSGKNGVVEARASISQYQDLSPLYGLLMYRRRKVLIKYIPEGTSRLLQARTTVHLQDFLEKYTPYDTLLELSTSEGLNDTSLAAAFPLHTAGGSPAISSPQLDEITEDAEEGSSPKRDLDKIPVSSVAGRRARTEKTPSIASRRPMSPPNVPSPLARDERVQSLNQKPSLSQFLVKEESGQRSVTQLNTPPMADYTPSEGLGIDASSLQNDQSGLEDSPIMSPTWEGKSTSPRTPDLEKMDYEKYYEHLYKPKVKLGPRPVSDKSKRPSTATNPRPVSSLPAGLHARSKPAESPSAPPQTKLPPLPIGSSPPQISMSALGFSHSPPPIPDESGPYPPRPGSRGSSRSLPISTRTTTSTKTSKTAITPEKLRLMKAMELRKKQMRRSTPPEASTFATMSETNNNTREALAEKIREEQKIHVVESLEEHAGPGSSKADSGIGVGYETPLRPDLVERDEDPLKPQSSNTTRSSGPRHRTQLTVFPPSIGLPIPNLDGQEANDSPTLGRTPQRLASLTIPQAGLPRSLYGDESTGSSVQATPEMLQTEGFVKPLGVPDRTVTPEISLPEPHQRDQDLKKRRRGLVEPLTIDISPSPNPVLSPEQNYLSDEDFYEELQSATFQEAKPIVMSRSPASPFFPRRPSARSAHSAQSVMSAASGASITSIAIARAPSNSVDRVLSPTYRLSPDGPVDHQGRAQSISSNRTPDAERGDPIAGATQRKVSSGISKRIAALAEKSVREGSPPGSASPQSVSEKSSFINMRKASLRDTPDSRPSSVNTDKRLSSKLSMWPGSEAAPTRRESAGNKDSISVTARIVRPSVDQAGSSSTPGELHHSPILINHTRAAPKPDYPPMDALLNDNPAPILSSESIASSEPKERPQSASYSVRSDESNATSARKSFGRYRGHESPRKSKGASTASIASDGKDSREDPEKPSSRTSRFFKRISTLGNNKSNKRKSITQIPTPPVVTSPVMSPTATEALPPPATKMPPAPALVVPSKSASSLSSVMQALRPGKEEAVTSNDDVPPPVVIGDLNVQFPDNLLWKRRWTEIDAVGNVIFTAAAPRANQRTSGFVTKFQMRELSAPYVPDIDAMARPHSVVFDLTDGTGATLTCASEDAMAQRQLLSLLTTYQKAWSTA